MLDIDSGKLLAAVNEHLALNPASNAKLYTAGAALATLHGEHRYETTLTGRLDGDAVAGPLAIRGFGDPSLSTADLWHMVQELKGFGVKRVDGDVVVDQRFFDEQTTPPAFEQQPNEWAGFRAPGQRSRARRELHHDDGPARAGGRCGARGVRAAGIRRRRRERSGRPRAAAPTRSTSP